MDKETQEFYSNVLNIINNAADNALQAKLEGLKQVLEIQIKSTFEMIKQDILSIKLQVESLHNEVGGLKNKDIEIQAKFETQLNLLQLQLDTCIIQLKQVSDKIYIYEDSSWGLLKKLVMRVFLFWK